ncbi:MAG: hypothetical protein U1E65_07915 [Myxococcota bacterium]
MSTSIPPGRGGGPRKAQLSPKAAEFGRSFLSALFMGVRTAQIHDAGNKAFERAVDTVRDAADQLYAATGSFTIQFVEESVFLNGNRLRFEGAAFETVRALREILAAWEMGGIEMPTAPSRELVQKMVVMLARGPDPAQPARTAKELLGGLGIGVLGFQRFVDASQPLGQFKVDSATFAVQSYAKLILSIQEQRAAVQTPGEKPPRLRVMRVIQDLVELGTERTDFLLRLALNREGAPLEDLHAANVCLLSIVLGQLIGLGRLDLVDLGSGALLHDLGRDAETPDDLEHPHTAACFLRLFSISAMTRAAMLRAIVAAEHHRPLSLGPHLFARIVAVADAFDARASRLTGEAATTVEALAAVMADPNLDSRLVDLLINALRAFPVGCQVVLDDGRYATVKSHAGGSRWDRPIVTVDDEGVRVDLMLKDADGRFKSRILATVSPG